MFFPWPLMFLSNAFRILIRSTHKHFIYAFVGIFTLYLLYRFTSHPDFYNYSGPRKPGTQVHHPPPPIHDYKPDALPVHDYNPKPDTPAHYPPPPVHAHAERIWFERAERVRGAFLYAYNGYITHAASHDELKSITGGKIDNFNGWHVTMVDALDTMWLMNFQTEFYDAVSVVANIDFRITSNKFVPFFETCIRYLGGLLSAYALSGEKALLNQADELGHLMLPVFKSPSGLPHYSVNSVTGETSGGWTGSTALLAEALSNQMEYKYLAKLTGKGEYYNQTERIMQIMYKTQTPNGMFPTTWNLQTGTPTNQHYSAGAFTDSAYEYFLKQYLLTSRSEPKSLKLYRSSIDGILQHLLYTSPTRNLLYVTDMHGNFPSHSFEHLACFLPGLIALGLHTLKDELTARERKLHTWAAEGLGYSCSVLYEDSATGLGPERVMMDHSRQDGATGKWMEQITAWEKNGEKGERPGSGSGVAAKKQRLDYTITDARWLLRPETIESIYLLYRTTGNPIWRDRGWRIFESIEKHTRTHYGFASLRNVDNVPVKDSPRDYLDEMPSFFLAETLKYMYLMFTEQDLVPLDKWVFNTEAHPMPVFEWDTREKEKYDIGV